MCLTYLTFSLPSPLLDNLKKQIQLIRLQQGLEDRLQVTAPWQPTMLRGFGQLRRGLA